MLTQVPDVDHEIFSLLDGEKCYVHIPAELPEGKPDRDQLALELTPDQLIYAIERLVYLRINPEHAVRILEAEEHRTQPRTVGSIANNIFLRLETEIFEAEMERREMERDVYDFCPDD